MSFPNAARAALQNSQLRRNLGKATSAIRAKRGAVVGEMPDWEELRAAGEAIKDAALGALDEHLTRLEGCPLSASAQPRRSSSAACMITPSFAYPRRSPPGRRPVARSTSKRSARRLPS